MNLLQRINEVRKAIDYIQKDKIVDNKYKAVTHDTVTALVRNHMVEHGIVMWLFLVESQSMPYEVNADMVRAKQFRYEATYDFTFANIDDPKDCLVIRIQAHAMDNADKAPGKAISYATKYAILKLFNLETGEDEESRFNPEGLDDDEFAEHLKSINEASSMETLKPVYAKAFKAAGAVNDKQAQKLIIKSYEIRKKSFSQGAHA